jgi:hypothetical protein
LRFVAAYQLEVHSSLYVTGGRSLWMHFYVHFRVNMLFGRQVLRNFILSDSP